MRNDLFYEILCPWCNKKVDLDFTHNGNHEAECDWCEKPFRYHVNVEIQGPDKIED